MYSKTKDQSYNFPLKIFKFLLHSTVMLVMLVLLALPAIAQDEVIPIYTLNDLARIGSDDEHGGYTWSRSASYELMNDIDASATAGWNDGKGWEPIFSFTGVLNGNGHVISGLSINRPEEIRVGFIGNLRADSIIKNIGLIDVNISGDNSVGALAGSNHEGLVENCFSKGVITGNNSIGGLVGYNRIRSTIKNCYSTASVTGQEDVGGLVGLNLGTRHALWGNTIPAIVINSYSTGRVDGVLNVGGLIGRSSFHRVTDSYWNSQTSGQLTSAGGAGAISRLTVGLTDQANFNNWDFDEIWHINPGQTYPYFKWQSEHYPADTAQGIISGLGREDNPYIISNLAGLDLVRKEATAHFRLNNSIDASATGDWNDGKGWKPIEEFKGVFNGSGYAISDLIINRPSEDFIGLFGKTTTSAEIKNLGLINVDITGNNFVGALSGRNSGLISTSHSSGEVTGNNSVGGLVGHNRRLSSSPPMTTIIDCFSKAKVVGIEGVGGLVGYNQGGAGSVIYGPNRARIANSYSTGLVVGEIETGGLVGRSEYSRINNSYYDLNTSGQTRGGTGKTTEEMYQQETYVDWDFEEVWGIDEGVSYPYHLTIPDIIERPDQPQNLEPAPGAENLPTNPLLSASEFSHPDQEAEHAATQWRITDIEGNYREPIYEYQSDYALTTIRLPFGSLKNDVTYYWQVRYQDDKGNWLEWSEESSFTTVKKPHAKFEVIDNNSGMVQLDASASHVEHSEEDEINYYFWEIARDENTSMVFREAAELDAWWLYEGDYEIKLIVVDNEGNISDETHKDVNVKESWFDRMLAILISYFNEKDQLQLQLSSVEWLRWQIYWRDLADIDEWLRYNEGDRLDWLKDPHPRLEKEASDLALISARMETNHIAMALNLEIADGLTYQDLIETIIEQERIANFAYVTRGTPKYHHGFGAMGKFIGKVGVDAAKTLLCKFYLAGKLPLELSLSLDGIGAFTSIKGWAEIVKELDDVAYARTFGHYVFYKETGTTWLGTDFKTAAGYELGDDVDIDDLTGQFENIYVFYSEYGTGHGLMRSFRDDLRLEVKKLILEAVDQLHKRDQAIRQDITELASPADLRVYDEDGSVSGILNGEMEEGINNAFYNPEKKRVVIYEPENNYQRVVEGSKKGKYDMVVYSFRGEENKPYQVSLNEIDTNIGEFHHYSIDWDAYSAGEKSLTIEKDYDGDGETDEVIITAPPHVPSAISPYEGAEKVSIQPEFKWKGGADHSEEVKYRLYLVTEDDIILKETTEYYNADKKEISISPFSNEVELKYNNTYYWSVEAVNEHGVTKKSSNFEFMTAKEDDIDTYVIALSAEPKAGGSVNNEGTFDEGKELTIEATANSGYEFLNWTENGAEVSADSTYTFTVNMDRDLVANFMQTETSVFSIGLYDPLDGVFHLKGVTPYRYGPRNSDWLSLTGDWNADDNYNAGLYDPSDGVFHLEEIDPYRYGPRNSSWQPLSGDWNGDGNFEVGLYDPSDGVFHLKGEEPLRYGPRNSEWLPLSGDWKGDGSCSVGLYDPSDGVFHLNGVTPYRYGPRNSDWLPLPGDWNGDSSCEVGLYDPADGVFHLEDQEPFRYGPRNSDWLPVSGKW